MSFLHGQLTWVILSLIFERCAGLAPLGAHTKLFDVPLFLWACVCAYSVCMCVWARGRVHVCVLVYMCVRMRVHACVGAMCACVCTRVCVCAPVCVISEDTPDKD